MHRKHVFIIFLCKQLCIKKGSFCTASSFWNSVICEETICICSIYLYARKTNSASLALVLRSYRKRYVLSITYPLSVGTHGLKTVSLRRDAYACSKTLIPLSPVGTREVKTVSLRRNAYKPLGQRM